MTKRWIPALAIVAMMGVAPAPPADAIGTGDILRGAIIAAQGLFITEADEVALGKATAEQVLQQYPRVTDPALNAYVTAVGQRVAASSDRPNLPYQFFIIDSKDINAFAAPGGYIFVTTGLLRFAQNEAQLAGVLAHEVGHVAKRHAVQSIRQSLIAQGVASALLGGNNSQMVAIAANIGANVILKGFDRSAELQADEVGATYSFRAGYDPNEIPRFLKALSGATGEVPVWLMPIADHPQSDDRVRRLQLILAGPTFRTARPLADGRDTYRRAVIARLGLSPELNPSPAPAKP